MESSSIFRKRLEPHLGYARTQLYPMDLVTTPLQKIAFLIGKPRPNAAATLQHDPFEGSLSRRGDSGLTQLPACLATIMSM